MTGNILRLFCLVDGESISNAFPVKIDYTETIGHLKKLIKEEKSPEFDDVVADKLTLWKVSVPEVRADMTQLALSECESARELLPMEAMGDVFRVDLERNKIHIIVRRPPIAVSLKRLMDQDPQYLPDSKKIRIKENWGTFRASDGIQVDLPPFLINLLASDEFSPEPRSSFNHLQNRLQAGELISIPSLGQVPKDFGRHGQSHTLFVTEQMLVLWEEMKKDQEFSYRRILSGPMGVGKSYLSYFLVAKAYAEGWPVLYVSDAVELVHNDENKSALALVKRFLALNKDILTGAEWELLVKDYDGSRNISKDILSVIFDAILKSRDRRTLLLIDEHGKLFEREPYLPEDFISLCPLSSFHWWGELAKGCRLFFTGTAHAKYEMTILDASYRQESVVYVGPLSNLLFSKLLDTYPRLTTPGIKEEVTRITNRVPRELMHLIEDLKDSPDPITMDHLRKWYDDKTVHFRGIVNEYHRSRDERQKNSLCTALSQTFLNSAKSFEFSWDFLDLGLVYRSKDITKIGTQHHILCPPARTALLGLFKSMPLPEDIRKCLGADAQLSGVQFESALFHQFIRNCKPIILNATDVGSKNNHLISLDFEEWDTLKYEEVSLGRDHQNTLCHGYEGYPRFDYMLGPVFIQVSISDFGRHNTGFSDIEGAFKRKDAPDNQIEAYLNHMFGPGHRAVIREDRRFSVTKDGVRVPGFRIVFMHGGTAVAPVHNRLVKRFPDVAYISYSEIKEKLFWNI